MSVNGEVLYRKEISSSNLTIELEIAVKMIEVYHLPGLWMEFYLPDAESPKETGDGSDTRILGVGLQYVEILPIPEPKSVEAENI